MTDGCFCGDGGMFRVSPPFGLKKLEALFRHITYEVFRDLGLVFAAVLILIYVLIVTWFKNFITPLIIMAPIPLTEQTGEAREVEDIHSKAD